MTLLKNCRVIPELTEGYDGQFADILIDGKFIAGICAPGTADAAADDECIDMEGKTVLPGLFDLHMHLNFDSMSVADIAMRAPEQAIVDGMDYAQEFLRNGYTYLRDCGIACWGGRTTLHFLRSVQQPIGAGQQEIWPGLPRV